VKPRLPQNGFTLTEMMLATALTGIVMAAGVTYIAKVVPMMNRVRTRQQVQFQARMLMDNIGDRLRNGKAPTAAISTPGSAAELNPIPNSRIDFMLYTPLASGATSYAIFLSSGIVYTQEFGPPTGSRTPRPIARNVSSLMFTTASNDPGVVSVTLEMDMPYDSTNDPTHVVSLLIPNQVIPMVEAP
jgi:prepilin-type N-terminal cleavage/methylation domain-containing protein